MPYVVDYRFALIDAAPTQREGGALLARARAARMGLQTYTGAELGRPQMDTVTVYRPEEEVFSEAAIASFALVPLTLDHPSEPVTAENYRRLSVGAVGQNFLREGEAVVVDLTVSDAEAVAAVMNGHRQLSVGYVADLDWSPGTTPDGQTYDAVQRGIRVNHLAIVDRARAGPEYRIGDSAAVWSTDQKEPPTMPNRTIIVDGIPVETTDAGAAAIETLQGRVRTQTEMADAAATELATVKADRDRLQGELAAAQSALTDAQSPARLAQAVARRARVLDMARSMLPRVPTDARSRDMAANGPMREEDMGEMDEGALMRRIVSMMLGMDAARDMTDAAVEGAFHGIHSTGAAAAAQPQAQPAGPDPLRDHMTGGQVGGGGGGQWVTDGATGWDKSVIDAAGVRLRQ